MRIRKYIFIAAFLMSIFISVSTKCGTTIRQPNCCIEKEQAGATDYYEHYNPLFIKYFF